MDNFWVVVRVENDRLVHVEWPERVSKETHRAARELILKLTGVDGVDSTQYREVVQVASHVLGAAGVAQDIANVLLDDSGAFSREWRAVGYADISVTTSSW